MELDISGLVRENIKKLLPYSSARDEFNGTASVFLDANENSLGNVLDHQYSRYPDPHQSLLKQTISSQKAIETKNIFLGNGSDECIDLLYRCFCNPGTDNVIICPPTYGMYEVSANINDIEVRKAPLLEDFQTDLQCISDLVDSHTKMIWICSPNNPTGNLMNRNDVQILIRSFKGLIVMDEAYIDFAAEQSLLPELDKYPNLVILQTFSKAWGLAGLRLGMAFASAPIIALLNKVKPPYNISSAAQTLALEALQETARFKNDIEALISLRGSLQNALAAIPIVEQVYPSEANFLLVRVKDAAGVYAYLLSKGIVVRNRANVILCNECLRITVGNSQENDILITVLINYSKSIV